MAQLHVEDPASTPQSRVTVFQDDALIVTELCDSEADAIDAVERWSDHRGIRCVVEDVSSDDGSPDASDDDVAVLEDVESYPRKA